MPIADSNGCRIYYETFGEGEPLLLVAGQASDRRGWDGVREGLQNHYHVIVYDHRGTGLSDTPTEPAYTTRLLAADAIAVLDSLGIERAHAYGVSMGGRICQWLGIEHSPRVASLILCSTTPGNAHGVARDPEINAAMAKGLADPEAARVVLNRHWQPVKVTSVAGAMPRSC
jgi:pimeloyl-ACP methyl ester carboxylesterase